MRVEAMDDTFVVTLDGPAGVGKTTLAKAVADYLGVAYLDTGAMYRSVAWIYGKDSWLWPEEQMMQALGTLTFALKGSGNATALWVNGKEIGAEIRTETVGLWASHVAKLPLVRKRLTQVQRSLGHSLSLVAEGRDMGTVVFPEARFKFFLDASPTIRAKRRWLQLQEAGTPQRLDDLVEQMRIRDEQDRNRSIAPLRPAEDAVMVDTGDLDCKQVLESIVQHISTIRGF